MGYYYYILHLFIILLLSIIIQQRDNNRMMKLYQQRLLTRVAVCGRIRTNTKPHVLADLAGIFLPFFTTHIYFLLVGCTYVSNITNWPAERDQQQICSNFCSSQKC